MQIILQRDIESLGKKYDVKNVKDGYARNFLIPKKLAIIASKGALKNIEDQKTKWAKDEKVLVEKNKEQAKKISKEKLEFPVCHVDGKAFGSVGEKEIATALEKLGYSHFKVELHEPLKTLGDYEVTINFGHEVSGKAKIKVTGTE